MEHSNDEFFKRLGAKRYRIKITSPDGREKIIEREMPSDIAISESRSNIAKNLLLWFVIAAILFAVFSRFSPENGAISQAEIKQDIVTAAKNGANLDIIKRIYENRKLLDRNILSVFSDGRPKYPYDIPLSSILHDIRADFFIGEKAPDPKLVSAINEIISDHEQKNPFDKLTNQQKDYFENVRQKIGDSYGLIQNDINNISDELYNQNLLVESYLSDSKTSLYISIFSLFFALIISAVQIYQGRPKKIADNLKVLLEGIFSDSNERLNKESEPDDESLTNTGNGRS